MKKYFFTGFITLLPIALTVIIVSWLFDLFTAPLAGIAETIILAYEKNLGLSLEHHDTLAYFLSHFFALILLIAIIMFLGFFGRKFLVNYFLKLTDGIFSRIPLVRTIYKLSLDVTKAMFSDTQKMFKATVLIPFPHHEALAVAFVTGEPPDSLKKTNPVTELTLFLPTAPHPMSGFVLLCPKKLALPVDVSIEDAFRFLVSAGVIHPGEEPPSGPKKQ